MTKTMSIRMDEDNYDFLNQVAKEEKSDLSKAVRDLVDKGRAMLAIEKYKQGAASLGKAAALAGLPIGQFMTTLTEYGISSNVDHDDYLAGLEHLKKTW